MTATEISCPTCATRLMLPPDNTATRFRCTQCGTVFDVAIAVAAVPAPVPAPPPPPPPPEPVPQPVAPDPMSVFVLPDTPTRRDRNRDRDRDDRDRDDRDDDDRDDREDRERSGKRRRRAEVDEEDEPKRPAYSREKTKGNTGLWIAIGACVGALLIVGGVVGAYYGLRDKPKDQTKADPPSSTPPGKGPNKPQPPITPEEAIRKVKASTVYIRTARGDGNASGSGFFAGKAGFVVTNAHVVGYGAHELAPPVRIEVIIDSGERTERTFPATIYGLDVDLDLALLKVDGREFPPLLKLGKSEDLIETQEVIAFGFPFGEQLGKNVSVNRTTVSSLRKINGSMDVVQLAGGLNPGNSGGPVANVKGEVIGVSVSKIRGADAIAFAIPAEKTVGFVDEQFSRGGYVRLGALAPFPTTDLEGTYLMVGLESRTRTMTEEQLRAVPANLRKIVIKGDQMTISTKDGTDVATIRLDNSKTPPRIDIISTKEGRSELNFGIYKLEDDVLTICASETGDVKDRPRQFKPDARSMMLTLRRQPDR